MIIRNLETLKTTCVIFGNDTMSNYKWFIDNICTCENMYRYFDSIEIKLECMRDFKQAQFICNKYEKLRISYKVMERGIHCNNEDEVYYFASTEGNCLYEWLHRAMEKYMCVGELHKAD